MTDDHSPYNVRQLVSIDDLSFDTISDVLSLANDQERLKSLFAPVSVAILMLQPSLRTRLGFAEAVRRLGGLAHVVTATREIPHGDAAESLRDTLRIAAGMTDLVVLRSRGRISDISFGCPKPLVNAGDDHEHPTQALIDMFAIEKLSGLWENLVIGISGDLQMRATRSLLKLIARKPPKALRLFSPPSRRGDALELVANIEKCVDWSERMDLRGLDVLNLSGLPPRRGEDILPPVVREAYALNASSIANLPQHARVYSPMPIIDEIAEDVRLDPRIAFFEQSDISVNARMAIIAHVLKRGS